MNKLPFHQIVIFLFCILLFGSCNHATDTDIAEVDVSQVKVDVNIPRLDKELFSCKNEAEILSFLNTNERVATVYFQTDKQGFAALAKNLNQSLQSQGLRDFYEQSSSEKFFKNITDIEADFREAFQHLKYYYPTFKEPKICTIFTGFTGKDMYVSDSLIVIGLDYFMGEGSKYRPDIYTYQLKKYQRGYIVPQIMLLLSGKYNETDLTNKTLLAEMVWYGKSYEFGHTMMPSKADSLFIGYSGVQLDETYASQDLIWAHLIEKKALYSIVEPVKAKYIGERPGTPEIGPRCPGSIGRWVGWRIVSKYYDSDPKLTIQEVMKNANAQGILEASKYKGLADENP
jgi:hypothetical protein